MTVITGEARHEAGDIFPAPQRQRRQLQPSGPSLGPDNQPGDSALGQVAPGRRSQEGGGLVAGEAQLGRANLGQLHHRQVTLEPFGEPSGEARAHHHVTTRARDVQLGRQQLVHPCHIPLS
jgi:hypothetical protein